MSLSAGERLGPYEILAPLGAAGMGEVYRARDAKLGREVAIKVLPEECTQHPQKLVRFEREARFLAPNRAHCPRATPGERALMLSHPIAEALEAAHEKGVIHRHLFVWNPDGLDLGVVYCVM